MSKEGSLQRKTKDKVEKIQPFKSRKPRKQKLHMYDMFISGMKISPLSGLSKHTQGSCS